MAFPKNICRICLNKNKNFVKIEDARISYNDNTILVLDLLNLFSDIKINENYPDLICRNCEEKAIEVYRFKIQCDQSNKTLKNYIEMFDAGASFKKTPVLDINDSANIKVEPNENGNFEELLITEKYDSESSFEAMSCRNDVCPTIKYEQNNNNLKKTIKVKHLRRKVSKRLQVNLEDLDKVFFCDKCNKHFKNRYILTAHMKRHENRGSFLCSICGKGFNSQACLTRHTRIHTGEKNYECQVCHKKFPSSNNLNLHSRIHSGVKPYLCTMCGKSFSHPSGLTYHIKTIHNKEKPYACEVCGKAFPMQCHVDRHRKIHSGERPFACRRCDKAFIKKIDLQRHEAIHDGNKPYVCDVCKKAFITKMRLTYHVMLHTKEKPHMCPNCGKGFIRRYYLKYHMNRSHCSIDNEEQENKDSVVLNNQ